MSKTIFKMKCCKYWNLISYNGLCIICCVVQQLNLVKGNRTLGKSEGFSEYTQIKQLIIHVVSHCTIFLNALKRLYIILPLIVLVQ